VRTGSLWWLWAWGAWVGFNLLLLVIYPTVIAPLFNKFQPLPDEA
jgi:STE24 endopeptidase